MLANFINGNGGSADVITTLVMEWDTTCTKDDNTPTVAASCAGANLRIVQPQDQTNCATSANPICATFNQTAGIPTPWPFTPTSNDPPNKWMFTAFTEGGIDLTTIFDGNDCVTSFLAETRTSASTSADLTDFANGDINTCGKIRIEKDAIPDDARDFDYTATAPAGETGVPAGFTLDDDGTNTGQNGDIKNFVEFDNVRPGAYSFSETLPVPGWSLTGLTCMSDKRTLSGYANGGVASFTLQRGETITCHYENKKQAKLTLVKRVVNDNGGTKVVGDFGLLTSAGTVTPFSAGVADGANTLKYTSTTVTGLAPGAYTLRSPMLPVTRRERGAARPAAR